MTILQSLERYYHRLNQLGLAVAPGWSRERFGWCVVLASDGSIVDVDDLRDLSGKRPVDRLFTVPASFKRSGTKPPPFFLWDKTAYALGIVSNGKSWVEAPFQHELFKASHFEKLECVDDAAAKSLLRFLTDWEPGTFSEGPLKDIAPDANIMFRLDGEKRFIHERPTLVSLVEQAAASPANDGDDHGICLITGEYGPIERLHPSIRGVEGANTVGASLVAFEQQCSRSYGKERGSNAPTSKSAAFRYGTALNQLLARDGPNRLRRPVGDATVVFWADASEASAAEAADDLIASWLDSDISDGAEAEKIREQMEKVAAGRPIAELRPNIVPDTRFHVLGLSPNAARLSVRFWLTDNLDAFAQRLARHHQDLRVDPAPLGWGAAPSVNRLLARTTALQGEFKNIPPLLAGEMMRAVLTGGRYPLSLLSAVLTRLRAGDSAATGWHSAVIRAVLVRLDRTDPQIPEAGETPMSLKRDHDNAGYQLGRLFAVYELAQRAALGRINATIRDKYFGAASATPASVFPLIVRGGQNHLSKVRKVNPGWGVLIERELEEINAHFEPGPEGIWPRSLPLRHQGEFAVGYYHQRATKLTNEKGAALGADDIPDTAENEGGAE